MYATINDMIARFGKVQISRLSQPEDHSASEPDQARVEMALVGASAVIDSYLSGRYKAPITNPTPDIVRACCIIARHDLADSERTSPSEEMIKAKTEVIKWLEQIAKEVVHLSITKAGDNGHSPVGSGPRIADRERIMTSKTLRGFI